MIYDSIIETIGDTPVVRLNHIAPDGMEMYVKVESFNPLASVKGPAGLGHRQRCRKEGCS